MASSKPDILLILLQKLMEEGNLLYKVCCGVVLQYGWGIIMYLNKHGIFCVLWCFPSLFHPSFSPPLAVCFSEGTYEGGGPALPVRPEEASS